MISYTCDTCGTTEVSKFVVDTHWIEVRTGTYQARSNQIFHVCSWPCLNNLEEVKIPKPSPQ